MAANQQFAVNNLDDTLLVLLVHREEGESTAELFSALQRRYDPRLEDSEFGPLYKLGHTYLYQGQRFSKICTFAGSLVLRVVFDTRQRRFDRSIIYRLDSGQRLQLLIPGGPETVVEENELIMALDG